MKRVKRNETPFYLIHSGIRLYGLCQVRSTSNMKRDTNNSSDDEFGSISEEEFNKKHMKALAQADPHNFKKKKKRRIKKEKPNPFHARAIDGFGE